MTKTQLFNLLTLGALTLGLVGCGNEVPVEQQPTQEVQVDTEEILNEEIVEAQQVEVALNQAIKVKGNGEELFEIVIKNVEFIDDENGEFEKIAVVTVEGSNIGTQGEHPLNEYMFNAYDEDGTVLEVTDVCLEDGWLYDYEFINEGRSYTSVIPYGVNGKVFELEIVEDIYYGEVIGSLFVNIE